MAIGFGFPVTVAGPRRIRTGFPLVPSRAPEANQIVKRDEWAVLAARAGVNCVDGRARFPALVGRRRSSAAPIQCTFPFHAARASTSTYDIPRILALRLHARLNEDKTHAMRGCSTTGARVERTIAFAASLAPTLLACGCGLALDGLGAASSSDGGAPQVGGDAVAEAPGESDDGAGPAAPDAGGAPADGGASGAGAIDGAASGNGTSDAPTLVAPPELAWYRLDETDGTTAHDSTANHYDITLHGVVWNLGANFAIPPGNGPSGGAVAVTARLRQAPVTFTAWLAPAARHDETSNAYGLVPFPPSAVSGDVPGSFGFGIGLATWTDGIPGSAFAAEDVGYKFPNVGGGPFAAGTEYFVVAAIGPSTATVYVNAQLVGQVVPATPLPTGTTTLSLGVHNDDPGYGSKRFYVGRIRDVRVYERVLAGSDVAALYADGPAP